ncbi:MAG TPA: YbdK family carboxylate-amine ligase [Ideonella sp.]|uniref:YbdK family carboxylate-amine ligase n=1 Tax=Ideonella sp. TaxID=1929293 RepID=UPI002BB24FFC|nr:YbdK family carboxylate-amine ligase [Ideonella sp.]HSI50231.1 YbdK family carboxylate-amine ligase [Ideonella sp.]
MQFIHSKALTLGMELELQIVSNTTGELSPSSLAFWEACKHLDHAERYSLEATLSTIELNTSVHEDADTLLAEALALTATLCDAARPMGLLLRGGGTQVTQFWNERVMAPTPRAEELAGRFGFLPKRFSTYGMHVHIGAEQPADALRMGNVLQALVPLFIACSAASPFLQMEDTGFCASRPLEPLLYPHAGAMPRFKDWAGFEQACEEIFSTRLASTLKDIYWDVRPKPEFGTIEVRVFDTPLSVHKAAALAAFTRGCAALALAGTLRLPDQPQPLTAERVSRFLACRDGLDAELFDPFAQAWRPARGWLSELAAAIAQAPVCAADLRQVQALVQHCQHHQDATLMRDALAEALQQDQGVRDKQSQLASYSRGLGERLFATLAG